MALSSLASYRNLLLATHCYKNENVQRFFGYVGQNGRTLKAKECVAFQDTFVHPQGVLARSAVLRDVSNGDVKYGKGGVKFISNTVVKGSAWTSPTFTEPGRLIGVYVDQPDGLNPSAPSNLAIQNRIAATTTIGSSILYTATDVISAANGVIGASEVTDLSGYLATMPYNYSGTVTISAPGVALTGKTYAVTNATPGVVTVPAADPFPFITGDAVVLTFTTGTIAGVTSATTVVYLGNVTRATDTTTFTVHLTQAAALAGTGGAVAASSAVVTAITPSAAYGDASGVTSPTATATGVSSAEVQSDGSVRYVPAKITMVSGGSGYPTVQGSVPTVTWGTTTGSSGTPIYAIAMSGGRIRSIDVMHPCDILPGGVLTATLSNLGTAATCRVTYAVATFSL